MVAGTGEDRPLSLCFGTINSSGKKGLYKKALHAANVYYSLLEGQEDLNASVKKESSKKKIFFLRNLD